MQRNVDEFSAVLRQDRRVRYGQRAFNVPSIVPVGIAEQYKTVLRLDTCTSVAISRVAHVERAVSLSRDTPRDGLPTFPTALPTWEMAKQNT